MVSGVDGNLVGSAHAPAEEALNISPDVVMLLLQPMVENIARENIIGVNPAITTTVS